MSDADLIRSSADSLRDECAAFLAALVRIPTVNPPGDRYEECARLIGDTLARLGYTVRYVRPREAPPGPPRINVVGRLEGPAVRPTLHFNGHFDVVPAGVKEAWTHDPFGGTIDGGRLWGRGTADQKAGIAASIFAIEAIRRAGITLRGSVEQSATVDEETGGFAGVAELCDQGLISADRTDHVIITEPLDVDRVCIGHRGVYWCEITARGVTAHGSMPDLGRNAAVAMARLVGRIETDLAPRLASRITSVPVEPPAARHASISLNALHAGQPVGVEQSPMVPDVAVAVFDRRFIAEESSADVRREIETFVEHQATVDREIRWTVRELMLVEPTATSPDGPVARAVRDAVRAVRGRDATVVASPGTYDQKHVVRRGGVADCIAYGPGRLETAHRPNEYVDLAELADATAVMALATVALVGRV